MSAVLLLVSEAALASPVVVFPLAPRNVTPAMTDSASKVLRDSISALKDVTVIDTSVVERKLGVHLVDQARDCDYDVFCLVEVGEIMKAERILIGHVRRQPSETDVELKLFVLDVAKALVVDTLVWKLKGDQALLEEAVRAGSKKLVSRPNATVVFDLTPANAEVALFGDTIAHGSGSVKFW